MLSFGSDSCVAWFERESDNAGEKCYTPIYMIRDHASLHNTGQKDLYYNCGADCLLLPRPTVIPLIVNTFRSSDSKSSSMTLFGLPLFGREKDAREDALESSFPLMCLTWLALHNALHSSKFSFSAVILPFWKRFSRILLSRHHCLNCSTEWNLCSTRTVPWMVQKWSGTLGSTTSVATASTYLPIVNWS